MNRTGIIALLALLAAAVVVLVLTLGSNSAPGPVTPPTGPAGPDSTGPAAAESAAGGDVGARDASAQRVEVIAGPAGSSDDPLIRKAMTGFRGRVIDHQGVPSGNSGVRIYRLAFDSVMHSGMSIMGGGLDKPVIVAGEVRTEEDGTFLVDGVWPRGMYVLLAGIDTDNPTHRVIQHTPPPGRIVDLGDVLLEARAVVTGIVVDEDGNPIAGALVRGADLPGQLVGLFPFERFDPSGVILIREPQSPVQVLEMPPWVAEMYHHLPIPSTESGADGRFRLVGLAAGSNLIATTKPGYLNDVRPSVRLKRGQERDLGRVRLKFGEELIGKVLDTEGKPVVGAEVVAGPTISIAPIDLGSRIGVTDDKGVFRAEGFPEGRVTVAARRGPTDSWIIGEPQSIFDDVVVQIPATHDLTVTVLSPSGEVVRDPKLRLVHGKVGDGALELAFFGFVPEVNLDGRTQELEEGQIEITGLLPGRYVVLASAPGLAVGSARVELDTSAEVTVDLPEQMLYSVRVTDSRSQGIRNVAIYAEARGQGKTFDMPIRCGVTTKAGTLIIDEINTASVRLSAEHPLYGTVHAESQHGAGEILMVMQEPGAIEGVLTQAGRRPEPAKWTLALERRNSGARGALNDVPGLATPDAEGRFAFRGLQPGRYRIHVIKSLEMLTSPGAVMELTQSMWMEGDMPDTTVEIGPGQVASVTLDTEQDKQITGPSARISGSVIIDGRIDNSLAVYTMGDGPRQVAKLDEAGRFEFAAVPKGDSSLTLLDPSGLDGMMRMGGGGSLWSRQIKVVANEDQDFQIDIRTSSISGSVISPDGSPVTSGWVVAQGVIEREGEGADSVWFNSEVDSNGRFSFRRIPEGVYMVGVRASGDRSARGQESGVRVESGLPVSGLTISVQWMVRASGRVDLTHIKSKSDWMYLNFEPIEKNQDGPFGTSSGARVDKDGSFEVDDLIPGRYRILFHHGLDQLQHPGEVYVGPEGLRDFVVRPMPKDG